MPLRTRRVEDAPKREMLDDIAAGLRRAAILQAAIELDIFTRIAEGHYTLPAIAHACASTERGTRLILNALVAMGLLSKPVSEYQLSPTAETHLLKGKKTYIGDEILADFSWDAHGRLAETIRSGKSIAPIPRVGAEDVPTILRKIGVASGKAKRLRVLDASRAVAKWQAGSLDVVLFGSSISHSGHAQIVGVFRKAFTALKRGGRLVIHAPMADDERGISNKAAMAGIDTLLFSPDGDVYTFVEYRGMLEAAGFVDVVNIDDDVGLVVARRVDSSRKK